MMDKNAALNKAMQKAEKKFNEYLEYHSYDPAFFSLDMKGFILDRDTFEPVGYSVYYQDAERKKSD